MSSDILLSNNVIIFLLTETILLFFQFISLYFVIKILKNWDFNSTSTEQYSLEKLSYFVTLIIYFTLMVKLLLLPFFVYTIDILSNIVPGAMCGAGVISSNIYGESLLILKVITLLLSSTWIIINYLDIKAKNFPYLKKKLIFFIAIFILLIFEFYLDISYFFNISTESLVTCCSAIYSSISINPLPFGISLSFLLILFYLLYFLSVITSIKKMTYLSGLLNICFLYISYYSVLYFFGTYVYQLPTHHCPFCMLQSDYFHIGYFIFISLFLGIFFGTVNFILKLITKDESPKYFIYSNIFNTIFVLVCSLYVIVYYINNGVFL